MPRRSACWFVIASCTFFPFAILTDTGSGAKEPDEKTAKTAASLDREGDPLPEGAVARLGTYRYHFMNSQCFASLSGDGKTLGLGSRDGTIRLLDAASGKEIRRAGQELIGGSAFAFNADGTVLVSLGNGGNMLLWDTVADKALHTLDVKKGTRPTSVTISANGKVVTAGIQGAFRQKNTVDAWEVATGKVLCSCEVLHSSGIRATLSADGKQLATWGYVNAAGKENPGQIIQVWSTASGVETWQLKDDSEQVIDAAFAPDGATLTSLTREGSTLHVWDLKTGKERDQFACRAGHTTLAYSPDGKTMAAATAEGAIQLWEVSTGKRSGPYEAPPCRFGAMAFDSENKLQAWGAAGTSGCVLWEVKSGKILSPTYGHNATVLAVAFGDRGKALYSAAGDSSVCKWDLAGRKPMRRFDFHNPHRFWEQAAVFSQDCKYIAAGGWGQAVRMGETASGKELCSFNGSTGYGPAGAFSQDGALFAVRDHSDREAVGVRLFDVATGRQLRAWLDLKGDSVCSAFSPDGKTVATGTYSHGKAGAGEVRLWKVDAEKEFRTLPIKDQVSSLAYSPDGALLAVAGSKSVELWDVASAKLLRSINLEENQYVTTPIVFGPNGKTLALGISSYPDRLGRVQIWEVASATIRRSFQGHQGEVTAIAFSPDNRMLATGSNDTTLLLWDVTGRFGAKAEALSADELTALWSDLASADATKADAAIWRLSDAPKETLPLLKKHLKPIAPLTADAKQIAQWIAELSHEDFDTRDKANHELEQVGAPAKEALQKTLDGGKLPAEAKRRVEALLDGINKPATVAADMLAPFRALEVLEHVGTPEAKELLTKIAKGNSDALLTREAKAALERMNRAP